ncbi:MAG: tetratricopeptide repeat protein [Merismopedia sp. SIO2A8]|nr:tetratricopeptide repeat protein [Merismopedia sp. SIO2A8]
MFSFRFTIPEDDTFSDVTLSQCEQQLEQWQGSQESNKTRLALMRRQARYLMDAERHTLALNVLEEAIALQPNDPFTRAYYGLVFEKLGMVKRATTAYQRAIDDLDDPPHPLTAQLWYRHGITLRLQGKYPLALKSYRQALALCPLYAEAISGRGVVLALIGRHKAAQREVERAVAIAPDSPQVLNNGGIIFLTARRYQRALSYFNRALDLEPNSERALYNKALIFSRLGQDDDAIAYLNPLLDPSQPVPSKVTYAMAPVEPWKASAWTLHGFLYLKERQFQTTIHSCRHAQRIQPNLYLAALYKFTATIASGQIWSQLQRADGQQELGHDLWVIVNTLKYRLLGLAGLILLLVLGQGAIANILRQGLPIVLSIGILGLIGLDLWRHKSRLAFVGKIYFRSGLLTYPRAALTLITTLITFNYAYSYAPRFMRWGWANTIFGAPGNIIFQPINLIQELSFQYPDPRSLLEHLWATIYPIGLSVRLWGQGNVGILAPTPVLGFMGTSLFHIGHFHVTLGTILMAFFWLALILGVPFWANLEERIFRQGANSWNAIAIRSTQFGLVHLFAGIPILGGFVLIVPGFLFACRYKYVRDRHYRRHKNPQQADAAGVIASTADHAVYNAILITLAIGSMLFESMLS